MHHRHYFEIKSLQSDNLLLAMESISVLVFSLFMTFMLPSMIYSFFFANQQLLEQPKILEYIPMAAFALGLGFFVYAALTIFFNSKKIKLLSRRLAELDGAEMDHGESELGRMIKMADSTIAQAKRKGRTVTRRKK